MREELTREEILRRRREWKAKHKKGPKKKPKKAKKKVSKRKSRLAMYKIYIIAHDRQKSIVGWYTNKKDAYAKWNEMLANNKKIIFPMRYTNNDRIYEFTYEMLMTKRKEAGDPDVGRLRDEYGKFVDHKINIDDWIVFDKAVYETEETFWVYGYHPLHQRKNFQFIFDEFVAKDIDDPYNFKNIYIFKNKVLFDGNGKLNMVICKNVSDAIRMYNQIEQWCKDRKYKNLMFSGNMAESVLKMDYVEKIRNLTHWNNKKILRNNLRP